MTKTRILVVEDELIVAENIKKILEDMGYTVTGLATSGIEAINIAEEDRPDLVLMDIVIQGEMDGIDAANKIRSRFGTPIVYLTAYADDKTLERAKISEPFGYIIKPFEDRELQSNIEMALYKSKMERKLRESEEWLSTTLKSIGDAVIATDKKGFVTFLNPVAESLTGWKHEDAIGKPLEDIFNIVNEKTGKQVENPVIKVIKKGVIVGLANHTMLIARDGAWIPIDDSGAPIRDDKGNIIGVILVFHDIAERRKAEKKLKESEVRLRTVVEASLDAIIAVNDQGNITIFNPAAEELFLYPLEEVINKPVRILLTEDVGETHQKRLERFLSRGAGQCGHIGRRTERIFRRKDGTYFEAEIAMSGGRSDDLRLVVVSVQDITERKQADKALKETKAFLDNVIQRDRKSVV